MAGVFYHESSGKPQLYARTFSTTFPGYAPTPSPPPRNNMRRTAAEFGVPFCVFFAYFVHLSRGIPSDDYGGWTSLGGVYSLRMVPIHSVYRVDMTGFA
jgi:hypothetical protein